MPFRNEAFEPEALKAMSAAYEKACAAIQPGPHAGLAKEVLAKRIIALAQGGCTDPERLCSEVLKIFGLERMVDGTSPPLSPTAH
jgi:hypothetical protein